MARNLLAAVLATFAAAGPALAQETTPPPAATTPSEAVPSAGAASDMRAKLMATDTDHDGKFSKAEWLAAGRKDRGFTILDADHDGFITVDELKAGRAKMQAMRAAMGK